MELRSVLARRRPEEIAGRARRRRLCPGDVVTVSGRARLRQDDVRPRRCRALGVTAPVTSPTYTIGHRYEGSVATSRTSTSTASQACPHAEWGDLEPYFDDAVVFVEWPEAAPSPVARSGSSRAPTCSDRRSQLSPVATSLRR